MRGGVRRITMCTEGAPGKSGKPGKLGRLGKVVAAVAGATCASVSVFTVTLSWRTPEGARRAACEALRAARPPQTARAGGRGRRSPGPQRPAAVQAPRLSPGLVRILRARAQASAGRA